MTRWNMSRSLTIFGLGLLVSFAVGLVGFALPSAPNQCREVIVGRLPLQSILDTGAHMEFCRSMWRESLVDSFMVSRGSGSYPVSWERLPDWTRWAGMLDDRWRHADDYSRYAAGWPMRSLVLPITETGFEWSGLRPLWIGLALNAVGMALLLEIAWLGTIMLVRARRHRAGQCMQCGYRLVDATRCPECGLAATSARPARRGAFIPLFGWFAVSIALAIIYAKAHLRYDRDWAIVDCMVQEAEAVQTVGLFCPDEAITVEQWKQDGIGTWLRRLDGDPFPTECGHDRHWALNKAIDGIPFSSLEDGTVMMYETSSDGPRIGDERDFLARLLGTGRAPAVIGAPGFFMYPDSERARELLKWSVE